MQPERPTTQPLRTLARSRIVALNGPAAGSSFHLLEVGTLIGRKAPADIIVDDRAVSTRHARVMPQRSANDEPQYVIEDLGSRNGTFVNGQQIQRVALEPGDKLRVGATLLLYTRADPIADQLLQSHKMEALGRLAGGVAHDFNNLLGALLGNINYLQAQPPTAEELEECLADMEAATRRGQELTMQLLGFTRGGGASDARPTDGSELLNQTVRLLERTFDRSIRIEAEIADGLVVLADRSQLQQVVMNVCINARDAMPSGGVLALTAAPHAVRASDTSPHPFLAVGDYVVLQVRDSGFGMDHDTLRRAFDPFFTTKARGEGTGLGLATVYGIVSDHGGHVDLDSEIGSGTVVTIYLPALDGEAIEPRPGDSAKITANASGGVLVVDDEEPVRRSTERLLWRFGFEVFVASGGAQALELLDAHREHIDVVLLDVIMPEIAGEEVYRRLRQVDETLPVVWMTGYAASRQSRKLVKESGLDVLKKPFDANELRVAVVRAMQQG